MLFRYTRWSVMALAAGFLAGCTTFPPLARDDDRTRQGIAGSSWRVASFWGKGAAGAPAISFDTGTGVKGFSGCNDFVARYTMKGRYMDIAGIRLTSNHPCDASLAAQEVRLFQALTLVRKVDLTPPGGPSLRMRHGVPVLLRR